MNITTRDHLSMFCPAWSKLFQEPWHADNDTWTCKYNLYIPPWGACLLQWSMMYGLVDNRRMGRCDTVMTLSNIDVDVMTWWHPLSICRAHVHWSFRLLCNCRVGMTYVRIVPSFITHSQLLATTWNLWAERSLLMLTARASSGREMFTFTWHFEYYFIWNKGS